MRQLLELGFMTRRKSRPVAVCSPTADDTSIHTIDSNGVAVVHFSANSSRLRDLFALIGLSLIVAFVIINLLCHFGLHVLCLVHAINEVIST